MKIKILLGLLLIQNIYLLAEDFEKLFSELNELSEEKKLNVSHKATSMYVLHGHELASLGVQNLYEALDFVPGIETIVGTSISSKVVVRGNAQPLATAQEKIEFFINGVEFGSNYIANFPMNLVDRVEIMKGSSLTGSSNRGLIARVNIITKHDMSDGNEFNVGVGSFDERQASAIVNERFGDWKVSFDAYYLKHNKKVDAPTGVFAPQVSPIPIDRSKESLEGVEDFGIGLMAENDNWSIKARHEESQKQNHYGFFGYLDFNEEGYNDYKTSTLQVSYKNNINQNNAFKISAGILESDYALNTYLYPLEPNGFGLFDPHSRVNYTTRNVFQELQFSNKSFEKHKIEYGVKLMQNSVTQNEFNTNVSPIGNVGLFVPLLNSYQPISSQLTTLSGSQGFFNNPRKHHDKLYYVKDYVKVNEQIDASLELRYDDNEHYKDRMNYKVGTIYSNDDVNIYKFIFSKQYRTPSTIESSTTGHWNVFGNRELEAESIKSTELIYVHKKQGEQFSLGGYYSIYDNTIDLKTEGIGLKYYNNAEKQKNYGLELKYHNHFSNKSTLLFNASFSEYLYKNKLASLNSINTPHSSKISSKLGYIYPLNYKTNIGALVKYYGKKKLTSSTQKEIDATLLVDLTTDYSFNENFKVYFTIKNALNQDYYYQGYNTTDEQMLREGRMWLVNLKHAF